MIQSRQSRTRIILSLIMLFAGHLASATVYTVNSTAGTNSGAGTVGTLPYCVDQVNAGSGGDVIEFSVAGTISLSGALTISQSVAIDGTTAPGYITGPVVEITNGGGANHGLILTAPGCTVKGLSINGFTIAGIHISSSGNTVSLCYIGLSLSGAAAANGDGIFLDGNGNNNTIGGIAAGNVISGNSNVGVYVWGTGNFIKGNYIGANIAGTAGIGNTSSGIRINATGNQVGGAAAGEGNLVSGNMGHGVEVVANNCVVQGNIVGMDATGTFAIANQVSGIYIWGSSNTIGGSASGERNYASGNAQQGIHIISGSANRIAGNYVGVNMAGTAAVPNLAFGIASSSGGNTIGGAGINDGNLVSGNASSGILIAGVSPNCIVQRNIVGLNAAGTAALGNGNGGIHLANDVTNSVVGGVGLGNIVSGNTGAGIMVLDTLNGIKGNYVGTNASGTAAIPNSGDGIYIGAANNQIGGTAAGEGNLVSGNNGYGINVAASRCTVQGNTVGMDAAGTLAIANQVTGIWIGGSSNIIGGSATGARNYVSGNAQQGIQVISGTGNTIAGNYVGVNQAGTAAVPNQQYGIVSSTGNNTIGGPGAADGNVASGNGSSGILIAGTSPNCVIQRNIVGLNAAGTAAIGNGNGGIYLFGGATSALMGGAGMGNVVSGNASFGIMLSDTLNMVLGNYVGTNANGTGAIPNTGNGIIVAGPNNRVGGSAAGEGNVVSGNAFSGIVVWTARNSIKGNKVGVNAAGTAAIGNGVGGVYVTGGNNTIGGNAAGEGNVISGNTLEGIFFIAGSAGSVAKGNYIGTNATGTAAIANAAHGITIHDVNITIGGSAAGDGNLISGNAQFGIYSNPDAANALVKGNIIGTNSSGTAAIGNGVGGIRLNGLNSTVGGTTAAERNLISGNIGEGLALGYDGDTAIGNYIGTDITGTAAIPNTSTGIAIYGSGHVVGGNTVTARNVVSGNGSHGIRVYNVGTANIIKGNYIGIDATGSTSVANTGAGVYIESGSNVIGGSTVGMGNVISGNSQEGIRIASGTGNVVKGNYIGTDATGTVARANILGGINTESNSNAIGGSTAGDRNVISGNGGRAVVLTGGSNTFMGNYVGLNAAGTAAVANTGNNAAITIIGSGNVIGGAGAGNVVSGNANAGITANIAAAATIIKGNYVGTDKTGLVAIPNGSTNIALNSVTNTVGGSTPGERNIVVASPGHGMYIASANNTVKGNYVGVGADGATAMPNGTGITVAGANNIIGGNAVAGEGNVVSGNTNMGIYVWPGASGSTIKGNYIGVDATGTVAKPNVLAGIYVTPANIVIGGSGTGEHNIVSGNGRGIYLDNAASNTMVRANIIGIGADGVTTIPNTGDGIEVWSSNNTIGGAGNGNLIAGNTGDGISVAGAGAGNKISQNSIYNNGGLAVDLNADGPTLNDVLDADGGPNGRMNFPVITSVSQSGGNTTVSGTFSGAASSAITIELFGNTTPDQTGYGEGQTYITSTAVNTNASGSATFSLILPGQYANVSATATNAAGNTSEFSYSALSFNGAAPVALGVCRDEQVDVRPLLGVAAPLPSGTVTWSQALAPTNGTLTISGATAASGSYSVTPGGTFSYSPAPGYSGPDAFTVQATDGTGTVTMVVNVTVYAREPIAGDNTVLFGQTVTLSNPVSGGSWGTPTPWTTGVNSSTGVVKGVSAGVSVVSYTTAQGCVSTHTVTMLSGVNACVGQGITLSNGGNPGGTWTSNNASIASVGLTSGVVTGMNPGRAVITYRVAVAAPMTFTVTVNPLAATVANPTQVCQGQSLVLTNNTVGGGTWYSGNTSTAVITSTGTMTGMAGGVVTIYFTPVAGCATTKNITVNAVAPIMGTTTVCVGQTTTVSVSMTGGNWSTSTGALANVSATGVITGVSAGYPRVSYIWPNGCHSTATVTVYPLSPINTTGSYNACEGGTIAYTNATPVAGAWSSSNTSVATISAAGVLTGIVSGSLRISYTTSQGCIATRTATVNPSPTVSGLTSVCVGQSIVLSRDLAGGTWTTGSVSIATVSGGTVKGMAAGSARISYILPTGCYDYATVGVNALSPITGGTTGICASSSMTLVNSTPGGGVWSSSNSTAATVSASGVVRGSSAGSTVISFTTSSAGCVATRTITVNACREAASGEDASIEDVTISATEILLFPNPNDGTFTIRGGMAATEGEAMIQVVNMLGQVVYNCNAAISDSRIDKQVRLPGNLASGTYILTLSAAGERKVYHFILGR